MNQLYEITYNETQLVCKGNRTDGYQLLNTTDMNLYHIQGDVIGIMQIDDDTFLIHRQITQNTGHIGRFKLNSGKIILEFGKDFKKFTFLTEDTILFDNELVYSISRNGEVPESKWIKRKKIEVQTDNGKPSVLFIEECIDPLKEYVQVLVDIHTFSPVSNAYSTLRDSKIPLTDSFTFEKLVLEDVCYIKIVKAYFFGLYGDFRTKGQKALLEEYNNKNK